jgi:hypothetical protein
MTEQLPALASLAHQVVDQRLRAEVYANTALFNKFRR